MRYQNRKESKQPKWEKFMIIFLLNWMCFQGFTHCDSVIYEKLSSLLLLAVTSFPYSMWFLYVLIYLRIFLDIQVHLKRILYRTESPLVILIDCVPCPTSCIQ